MVDAAHGTALAVVSEQDGALSYKVATNAAHLCGEIVKATAQNIQGRKYVRVEGWLAIAAAHGCLVSIRDVRQVEGGVCAVAELRRISDQALLATAEGFVGEDETMWARRPLYARRAMAQTRASSRVCRSAFAHVVVMIGAGLQTTPAEEMPQEDWAAEAVRDGLATTTRSHYEVDKEKRGKDKADALITHLNTAKWESRDALEAWWDNENAIPEGKRMGAIDWLKKNCPTEYERVEGAYLNAEASCRA